MNEDQLPEYCQGQSSAKLFITIVTVNNCENTDSGSNKRELRFVACSLGARRRTKRLTRVVSLKPHSSPGCIPSVSALGGPSEVVEQVVRACSLTGARAVPCRAFSLKRPVMARQGDFTQIRVLVVLLLALSSVCSIRNCAGELHEFFYHFTLGQEVWTKGFGCTRHVTKVIRDLMIRMNASFLIYKERSSCTADEMLGQPGPEP